MFIQHSSFKRSTWKFTFLLTWPLLNMNLTLNLKIFMGFVSLTWKLQAKYWRRVWCKYKNWNVPVFGVFLFRVFLHSDTFCASDMYSHSSLFKAPTSWPSFPLFLKSLFSFPSFLFHFPLKVFQAAFPTLTQSPPALIRHTNLPYT